MDPLSRFQGCLLGLAAGDALGTTLEFQPPGMFTPLNELVGGGPFHLKPGEWTDDTSMALCLAESLVERQCFDPHDQMQRYLRWYRHGHLSVKGYCFDIGNTTLKAMMRYESNGEPYSGSTDPFSAGNGSIMRLAPVAMAYAGQPEKALEFAALSSRTTHGAEAAVDACRYLAALLVGALNGADKDALLSKSFSPVAGYWERRPLHEEVREVAEGSFKVRQPPEIEGSGFVVKSLEAALWAFYHSSSFREGCLKAVNLGDDADTTGAVYGQLAGAFYGADGIPEEWRQSLAMREHIEANARQLFQLNQSLVAAAE